MSNICPNLSTLIGDHVAARLIQKAGLLVFWKKEKKRLGFFLIDFLIFISHFNFHISYLNKNK